MATLFHSRKLAEIFEYRNVVIMSRGNRSHTDELTFELELDFGKWGRWVNRFSANLKNDRMWHVANRLQEYTADLLEQIGALEELQQWSRGSMEKPFSKVLMQDKPMFFHAAFVKGVVNTKVFGEGLHDMEIRHDTTRTTQSTRLFQDKLESLRSALADHIRSIEVLPLQQSVQGVHA